MKLATRAALIVLATAALAATKFQHRPDRFTGTWDVQVEPDNGGKTFKAQLIFKGDKLTVQSPMTKGFEPGTYDVDTRGVTTNTFNSTITSPKDGKMAWSGMTSSGQEIKGEMKWTKANGDTVSYTYSGNRKG